ncbi:MAG: hypothetical protein OHK0022_27340 [Roseiflexaceae bacterium]
MITPSSPTIIGVIISVAFIILYVVVSFFKRRKPVFDEGAAILLSCTATVVSIDFFRIVALTDIQLGKLEEHRITMIVGAFAVIWTSLDSVIKIYYSVIINKENKLIEAKDKSNQDIQNQQVVK